MKTRTNTLWTASMAKVINKPYKTKAGTITTGHCPICSFPNDSPGHILGGCTHPQLKSYYIARHLKIQKCTSTGPLGSSFQIMDATSETRLPLGVHGTRLPSWMVPLTPPSFAADFDYTKLRPDLLIIEGLSYNGFLLLESSSSLLTPATQTHLRNTCKIHIVEVGYTSEYSLDSCTFRKHTQHSQLIELLLHNQWSIASVPPLPLLPFSHLSPTPTLTPPPSNVYVFILGSSGFIFKPADTLLERLGASKSQIHSTLRSLGCILCLRRRLENSTKHFRPVLLPDPP